MLFPLIVLVVAVMVSGCSATEPRVGPPAEVLLVGPPISGVVATDVEVTVKVVDARGVALPNQLVSFAVEAGNGSFASPSVTTSETGEAKNVWTLGTASGFQWFDARVIDRATGQPGAVGFFSVDAQPGPPVRLELGRFSGHSIATGGMPVRFGATVNVASLVRGATDAYGNAITSLTVTVTSALPGWTTDGAKVTAPSTESEGTITFRVGGASATVRVFSVRDLRQVRLRTSWGCTHTGSPTRVPTVNGVQVDSTVGSMIVDSARADTDPGPRRGQPYFGWPATGLYSYVLYASGTSTRYLTNGTAVTAPAQRDFVVGHQYPDSIYVTIFAAGPRGADGIIPNLSMPSHLNPSSYWLRRDRVSPLHFGPNSGPGAGRGCVEQDQLTYRFVLEEY